MNDTVQMGSTGNLVAFNIGNFGGDAKVSQISRLNVLISPSCSLPAAELVSPPHPRNPRCHRCAWGDDLRRAYGSLRASGACLVMNDTDQACRLLSACFACHASSRRTVPRMLLVSAAEPDGSVRRVMTESADGLGATRGAGAGLLDVVRKLVRKAQGASVTGEGDTRGGLAFGSLRRTREYIERQLSNRIRLCELADIAGLSAGHFSRAFRQSVGMPPYRYVLRRRIAVASELIRETDRPLAEVALSVGFSDQSHFTRVFTRESGETPSAFRRKCR